MKADLHVHSTASDGTVTPSALVQMALDARVDILAIADHDSVEGLAEAFQAASDTPLEIIPAVELSSARNGVDAHILAYFIDPLDPQLDQALRQLRIARRRRAEAMVAALSDAGYSVTIDDVLALSDGGAVGRSHVARALVGSGAAESVSDAFRRLIGRGMPFYVPKESKTPEEVVSMIRSLGGIPVLAHPGVTGIDAEIPLLVEAGLLGIEAYHADHTERQRQEYAELAATLGLLATGGTDFHGPYSPNPPIGSVYIPEAAVRALLAAAQGA
jgi:predicted metal-dependent phosphoesterase TrpH